MRSSSYLHLTKIGRKNIIFSPSAEQLKVASSALDALVIVSLYCKRAAGTPLVQFSYSKQIRTVEPFSRATDRAQKQPTPLRREGSLLVEVGRGQSPASEHERHRINQSPSRRSNNWAHPSATPASDPLSGRHPEEWRPLSLLVRAPGDEKKC